MPMAVFWSDGSFSFPFIRRPFHLFKNILGG
mgnify:CR=1 FL=1